MRYERVSGAGDAGADELASRGLNPGLNSGLNPDLSQGSGPGWPHAAANVAVAREQAVAHPFMSIRSPKEPGFSDVRGQLLLWSLPVGDYGGSGYMLPLLPELLPPLY